MTFWVADKSKLGGDEVSGKGLSGGSYKVARYGNLEYGSEELEESVLWYTLGEEGGYEIGFSYDMFEGNEYGKVEGRSLVDILQVKVGSEVGPCDEI